MTHFGTDPIFSSYWAVAAIAAVLSLLLLVGPQFTKLSRPRWFALVAIRLLAILLLTLAMLRPTQQTTLKTPRTSSLLILFDTSRSMLLPSGRGEASRYEVQQKALAQAEPLLLELAKTVNVKVFAYDSKLVPVFSEGKLNWPAIPTGEQTDLGSPLDEALRGEQGQRLAGVVLIGDGAQNAFDPQIETQEAARKLRDDFAAPLFAATIGPAADAAQTRDIAIERLEEQFVVFVKNELTVRAMVRIRGYKNQDIPVELILEDSAGKKQTIGSQKVRSTEDGAQVPVEFNYTPQVTGQFRLTVSAKAQTGELVTKNNQLEAYLLVREGGLRVLALTGNPQFELKFLRQSLNTSPDIELDYRILDRRSLKNNPKDLTDDIKKGKYDAFLLQDLEASSLTPQTLQTLADQVASGKGLLMLGGSRSFGRGKYLGTPLADTLPIVIDSLEGADFGDRDPDQFYLEGPLPLVPTSPHPLTSLSVGADQTAVWKKLPPLRWANKFARVKQAPGVRVLLESPAKAPLLVSGEFGKGRVLAFAGESTFLWTMHGYEKEHKRFWRQTILWLVGRDDQDKDDVWIKLDQRRINPGGRIQISAGARTPGGDPILGATFETTLTHPDGKKEPVKLAQSPTEALTGSVSVLAPGNYTLDAVASFQGAKLGTARAEFLVFDRDLELSNPAADPDQMASLVAWTKQDGGRVFQPEELSALLTEIKNRPQEFEVRQTQWKLGGTAADAWTFFLVLVGVLGFEWWLRKKWGLV